jgi:hypothetical protein
MRGNFSQQSYRVAGEKSFARSKAQRECVGKFFGRLES